MVSTVPPPGPGGGGGLRSRVWARAWSRLGLPDTAGRRPFVLGLAVDAVGTGVWMPLALLYFLHQTTIPLATIGTTMTVGGVAALPALFVVGRLVDGVGARRVAILGNLVQAVAFTTFPLVQSPVAIVVGMFAVGLGNACYWGSIGPMVITHSGPGERELWFGLVGALRNAGGAVAAALVPVVIALDSTLAYHLVVLGNALTFLLAAVLLVLQSEPATRGDRGEESAGGPGPSREPVPGHWWSGLGDPTYDVLNLLTLLYLVVSLALVYGAPLYVVHLLHLPTWVVGATEGINLVLAGLAPGLVIAAMRGAGRRTVLVLSGVVSLVAFLLFDLASDLASGPGTAPAVVAVLIAAVLFTVAELLFFPVLSTLAGEYPPAALRGRYMAVNQLAITLALTLAPAVYSFLLSRGGSNTWVGASGLCVLGVVLSWLLARMMPMARQRVAVAPAGE